MRYLLDANAVIAILKDPDGPVARRLQMHDPGEVGLSAIASHELYYGAYRSQRREHNLTLVDALRFEVVDFDLDDGRCAGEVRAALAARGTPIGPYDVLIAGQARARDLILVTANLDEFQGVEGLVLEDWSGG